MSGLATSPTLEEALEGLYASPPQPLPFAPALHVRAFLLRRARGNLLIYSAPKLAAAAVADLGGVARRYLNHGHEAMFMPDGIEAPLFVHAGDRRAVAEAAPVRAAFSRRHTLDEDFEVIPIPGHTPGATAYLWDAGSRRFLFTGDTIYLSGGEWAAAVLASSDRAAYVESLELIRGLDFDVLVPWAAGAGEPPIALTDRAETERRIDAILTRVRRGAGRW